MGKSPHSSNPSRLARAISAIIAAAIIFSLFLVIAEIMQLIGLLSSEEALLMEKVGSAVALLAALYTGECDAC